MCDAALTGHRAFLAALVKEIQKWPYTERRTYVLYELAAP